MALTLDDIRKKQFSATRLREGYDMTEVDAFLDQIEVELERLLGENEELRHKLGMVSREGAPAGTEKPKPAERSGADQARPGAQPQAGQQQTPQGQQPGQPQTAPQRGQQPGQPEKQAEPAQQPAAAQAPAESSPAEQSNSAVRVLEMATRHADQLVSEAQGEAEKIVADARKQSEELTSETDQKRSQFEEEMNQKRQAMMGDLEGQRAQLQSTIEGLAGFEREHRSRMTSYFNQQLKTLDETKLTPDNPPELQVEAESKQDAEAKADPNQAPTDTAQDAQQGEGNHEEPKDQPHGERG